MKHESRDDYLEAIYILRGRRGCCRNIDIACLLGRSKPSVTKALAKLSDAGFIRIVDRDVRLTSEGETIASKTLERHLFFERLLLSAGVDDEAASKEACRMEHCLSEESFEKLTGYLTGGLNFGKDDAE